MKIIGLILITCTHLSLRSFGQSNRFDVFNYEAPEYSTKSELQSKVQFNLTNSDSIFCTITLFGGKLIKGDTNVLNRQWNEYVIKRLTKADKKPQQILSGKQWDGWNHTVAIGNFYRNKKKCVVMLNSFTKDKVSAAVVFALSDKSFKQPIELFSKQLHLNNNK